jgi:redox-sensitive bicupin YhaK (pirin superfamily)
MSAGSGIRHSEYNKETTATRIFQIWIMPNKQGGEPSWGAKPFPKAERSGKFAVLASGMAGDEDALRIRADARVLGVTLKAGQTAEYALGANRRAYFVPAVGVVEADGVRISARDGAAVDKTELLKITAIEDSEVVLVDVA